MYTIKLDNDEMQALRMAIQRKMDYYAENLKITLDNVDFDNADVWYKGMQNLGSAWKKLNEATIV